MQKYFIVVRVNSIDICSEQICQSFTFKNEVLHSNNVCFMHCLSVYDSLYIGTSYVEMVILSIGYAQKLVFQHGISICI